MKKGDWYDAKMVEDTVESLSETAGSVRLCLRRCEPRISSVTRKRSPCRITFDVAESPRVFVERIDINGNTLTQDKVVRREFRLE